jgi:hypothetical protein
MNRRAFFGLAASFALSPLLSRLARPLLEMERPDGVSWASAEGISMTQPT